MFGFSLNPIDWITDAAGTIIGGVSDGIFDAMTAWVESALSWFAQEIAVLVTDLGNGDFSDGGYAAVASMFRYAAIATVVGTIMLATAGAAMSKRVALDEVLREVPVTLAMIAGWGAVCSIWFAMCRRLTVWALSDALNQAFTSGLTLDSGIASFFRLLIALVMLIALVVFAVEMLFIGFLGPFAVAIGPISLALRPWPALRDVAKRMVMNLVLLTLTPFVVAAAMSLAVRDVNGAGVLGVGQALRGMCGMLVAVLMPAAIKRYLPLDGQGGGEGRAMMAAAAGIAASVAGIATAGGAAAGGVAAGGAAAGGGQLTSLTGGAAAGGSSVLSGGLTSTGSTAEVPPPAVPSATALPEPAQSQLPGIGPEPGASGSSDRLSALGSAARATEVLGDGGQ